MKAARWQNNISCYVTYISSQNRFDENILCYLIPMQERYYMAFFMNYYFLYSPNNWDYEIKVTKAHEICVSAFLCCITATAWHRMRGGFYDLTSNGWA